MGLASHVHSLHPFCYHPRPPFPQIEDHNSLQLHTLPPALPLQSVPTQTPVFWRVDICAFTGPSPLPGPCPGSAPLPALRGSAPGPPRVSQPQGSGEDMGGQGGRRELRPRTMRPSWGVAKRHHGQSKRVVGGVTGPQVTRLRTRAGRVPMMEGTGRAASDVIKHAGQTVRDQGLRSSQREGNKPGAVHLPKAVPFIPADSSQESCDISSQFCKGENGDSKS